MVLHEKNKINVLNLEKFFWNPVKSISNAGHMKQDGVLVGGLQGLHFELFGIVNNKWNFSMELINIHGQLRCFYVVRFPKTPLCLSVFEISTFSSHDLKIPHTLLSMFPLSGPLLKLAPSLSCPLFKPPSPHTKFPVHFYASVVNNVFD